jgi:hypothetical protein
MMIKQFKEIDDFFKKSRFNDNELVELKNLISNNYKDLNDINLAYSIIDLQLLKFEMIVNETTIQKKTFKVPSENKNKTVKKPKKTKPKKIIGNAQINTNKRVENTKNINLLGILDQITETESKEYILNLLRKKGIYKGRINITLTSEEYNYIKDELKNIIKTNKAKDPTLRIKRSKTIKKSKSDTVYDKLKTMNGLGKIIYIRSR